MLGSPAGVGGVKGAIETIARPDLIPASIYPDVVLQ